MSTFEQEALLDDDYAAADIQPIPEKKVKETASWTRGLAIAGLVINTLALLYTFYSMFDQMGYSPYRRYKGDELVGGAIFTIISLAANIGFCILLYQYSSNLRRVIQAPTSQNLSDFFERQKVFWMVMGIATLGIILMYMLGFVIAIFA